MRLVLSRKGFDSSAGGCPNPVFPDGSSVSLPIPDSQSPIGYGDVRHHGGAMGSLVEDLTGGRVSRHHGAHLDPDLIPAAYPRSDGWRPVLGQHGAAQAHLLKQGVGEGDLFLFFAVFRQVDRYQGRWRFVPGTRPFHALWGWLQVSEIFPLQVGHRPPPAWTHYHPHHYGDRGAHNTLYLAGDELTLPGAGLTSTAGAGVFPCLLPGHRLTGPDSQRLTDWQLPAAFYPCHDRPPLSYHHNPGRWRQGDNGTCTLRSVARGQEFVLDMEHYPELVPWLAGLFDG